MPLDKVYQIICELLGMTDAIFSPYRFNQGHALSINTFFARKHFYNSGGIRWRSNSADEMDRKRLSRAVDQAEESGLLEKLNHRSGKTVWLKLTELGEETARHLGGFFSPLDHFRALVKLHELWANSPDARICGHFGAERESVWVTENDFVGLEHNKPTEEEFIHELWMAGILMAPFTRRGWVTSQGMIPGNVLYAVCPDGEKAVAAGPPVPLTDLIMPSEELTQVYADSFCKMRETLHTAAPENTREIGYIPISASLRKRGPT